MSDYRTVQLYQNVNTGSTFTPEGALLGNDFKPFIKTNETILTDIQYLNSDPDSNAMPPTDVYTGWAGKTITGSASIDNNFKHVLAGVLTAAKSGTVSAIAATITDTDYVNPTGILQLENSSGLSETVEYSAYTKSGTTYTFTVSATLTNSYALGDICNVADTPLAKTVPEDFDLTYKDTGRLIIKISANNAKFYNEIKNQESISDCALEIQIFDTTPIMIFSLEFEIMCLNIRQYFGIVPPPLDSDFYTKAQVSALLAGKESTSNKATSFSTVNDTLYPSVKAVNDAITQAVVGLIDDRGNYNASVNTFPASGGSGTAGAVLKGDLWFISVAGTLGGAAVDIGDQVRALSDAPGQTAANWAITQANITYTPENAANKVTSISGASTDTQYPSAKLTYDQLALKAPLASPVFTGSIVTPIIKPATDSTTAVKVTKADGTTSVFTVDTTNSRIAVGNIIPSHALDIVKSISNSGLLATHIKDADAANELHIGVLKSSDGSYALPGIWMQVTTPSFSNYAFMSNPTATSVNAVSGSELDLRVGGSIKACINSAGKMGVGVAAASTTAMLHLPAGTAAAGTAPLKLTSGTNLTTPEAGAIEFDGSYLYYTDSTAARQKLARNVMTTAGDIIYGGAAGVMTRLAVGTAGQVLKVNSGATALEWAAESGGMTNPMTTAGDIIVGGTSGAPARLAKGANNKVLTMVSGAVAWADAPGASGGEANTASNVGTAGVGIFKQKTLVDLELYKLLGSSGVSIALNGTDYIDVKADINSLTEDTTPDAANDYVMTYDTSATANKKVKLKKLGMVNPMSASGDIIYGGTSGAATRLAKGTDGQVLKLASGVPIWAAESGGGGTGGLTATEVTTDTTIENGKLYIANSSSMLNFTLPATFAQGFTFGVLAKGTGGWTVKAGASSQVIYTLSKSSGISANSGDRLQVQSVQHGYCEYIASTANTTLNIITDISSDYFPTDKGYSMGYFNNASSNVIDTLVFSTEACSALTATLSSARDSMAGVNSTTKGYTMGSAISAVTQNVIDALVFSTEACSALSAVISQANAGGAGFNSTLKGYLAGGTAAGSYTTVIDALVFGTESCGAISATLSASTAYSFGFNSSAKGYCAGGSVYGASYTNKIEALTFSNESRSTISATLSGSFRQGSDFNSTTKGYCAGGANASKVASIDALLFSNESVSTISATLSTARGYCAGGINSLTKGYSMGGDTGTLSNVIDALVFANETNGAISATLTAVCAYGGGFQSGGIL